MDRSLIIAGAASVTAAIDLATKATAEQLSATVAWQPERNPGLMLELVSLDLGALAASALLVALGCALVLGAWARRGIVRAVAVGLVLGGCLGNLADRALLGAVRDFLVIGPVVVNVADLALAVGAAWCIVSAAGGGAASPLGCDERSREGASDAVRPG